MKVINILLFAFFISVCILDNTNAKPRLINLIKELDEASLILKVKIVAYENNALVVEEVGNSGNVYKVKYSKDPSWLPETIIEKEKFGKMYSEFYSEQWPPIGSLVLIVVDQHNIVSLFAFRLNMGAYRFWSPQMTGSYAYFECKPPSKPLPNLIDKENKFVSIDGCLLDPSVIKIRN